MRDGTLIPVLCGSAVSNIGVVPLLDFMVDYLPNPLQAQQPRTVDGKPLNGTIAALVFKTVADPFGKLSYFRLYSGDLKSDAHLFNANRSHEERIPHLLVVRGKTHDTVTELHAGDIGAALKLQDTNTGDTLTVKDRPAQLPPIHYPEPSYSASIEPKTRADLDKLGGAVARLIQEDPTLHWHRDAETAQSILSGMGESHLQVAVDRLHRKFGTEVTLGEPKIPYRETISSSAKAQGRHKRQSGGHGQFGDVHLEVEPLQRGSGYAYVDKIVGGAVPRQFIPAVDKGIQEALKEGQLTGNPVVDVRVTLFDGSFHAVDSSEMAFKTAAAIGFRAAVEKAHPILLEPVMDVEVQVPTEYMGDVVGDLNSHRARILGMDPSSDGMTDIKAQVPMAEMFRYATTLRSLTQGRASYTMHLLGYEEAPAHITQQVSAAYHKAREQKEHK
jgi:elongation factor G